MPSPYGRPIVFPIKGGCQVFLSDPGDAENRGPLTPGAPGMVAREDPGFAFQRFSPVPLEEHHVVVIRAELAEAVYPGFILLRDVHPVAVLSQSLHGSPFVKKSASPFSDEYSVHH